MSTARTRATRAIVSVLLLCACHATPPRPAEPANTASTEWSATLFQTRDEVAAGRYAVADRILSEFSARYPASLEATEAVYWRALFKLDPANPAASSREAATLLDSYLAAGQGSRRMDAQVLRRIAATFEARTITSAGASAPAPDKVKVADDKAKDEELARVKDELAKANAELERIKRRLAKP